jgi:hypothetical protein
VVLAGRLTRRWLFVASMAAVQIGVVVWEGGDWMPGYRQFVPVLPALSLLLVEGYDAALAVGASGVAIPEQLPAWLEREKRVVAIGRRLVGSPLRWLRSARVPPVVLRPGVELLFSVLVVWTSWGGLGTIALTGYRSGLDGIDLVESEDRPVVEYLRSRADPGDLTALGEAGYIPYATDLPILDLFGLMDPYIARLPGVRHSKFDVAYVLGRRPVWVVLAAKRDAHGQLSSPYRYTQELAANSRFATDYEHVFEHGNMHVYRRRDGTDR